MEDEIQSDDRPRIHQQGGQKWRRREGRWEKMSRSVREGGWEGRWWQGWFHEAVLVKGIGFEGKRKIMPGRGTTQILEKTHQYFKASLKT